MRVFLSLSVVLLSAASWSSLAVAQTPPPVIFFTDVQSGPNSGGDAQGSYSGAYVTIYGNFFGATQGTSTVTLNGSSCMRVVSWGTSWLWYQRIVVQLGASCSSGNLVVSTSAGQSNGVPFTVRSGNIYCISPAGSDNNSGKFPSSCWSTLAHALSAMSAGDTVYLQNGVVNANVSNYSAVANVQGRPGGTAANPIAIVAYPGANATIGSNSVTYAIRVPQIGVSPAYYVIAGLTLRGGEGLEIFSADNWRLVANDLSCPAGSGYGCTHIDQSTNIYYYGNYTHNITGKVKLYHGVYFTTNTNHVWVGWNLIDNDPSHTGSAGCRGLQFYSTGGNDMYDVHVHDNIIRNTDCDGIAMTTMNPNQGSVEVYNNVIYNAGMADPGDFAHYTCLQVASTSTVTTPAQVYNNTLYNCGSRGGGSVVGALSLTIPTNLTNNVIYSVSSAEPYLASDNGPCSLLSGSNNLWFGAGPAPCSSNLSGSLNVDPKFVAIGSNFQLQTGSPAIDGGASVSAAFSIDGVRRPQGSSVDRGAYEFFVATTTASPCDLNGDGSIDASDVALAVNQALGVAACSSGDLDRDGSCTVVDVQRVVNSTLGQGCRVGP
jgi:hypothetical protein